MRNLLFAAVFGLLSLSIVDSADAQLIGGFDSAAGGSSRLAIRQDQRLPIIATGELKKAIKSIPIEWRPDRPFHIYGNTVRRRFRRSHGLPVSSKYYRTLISVPTFSSSTTAPAVELPAPSIPAPLSAINPTSEFGGVATTAIQCSYDLTASR